MRILKELNLSSDFVLQDIKENPLSVKQVEELHKLSGSYEALSVSEQNFTKKWT